MTNYILKLQYHYALYIPFIYNDHHLITTSTLTHWIIVHASITIIQGTWLQCYIQPKEYIIICSKNPSSSWRNKDSISTHMNIQKREILMEEGIKTLDHVEPIRSNPHASDNDMRSHPHTKLRTQHNWRPATKTIPKPQHKAQPHGTRQQDNKTPKTANKSNHNQLGCI